MKLMCSFLFGASLGGLVIVSDSSVWYLVPLNILAMLAFGDFGASDTLMDEILTIGLRATAGFGFGYLVSILVARVPDVHPLTALGVTLVLAGLAIRAFKLPEGDTQDADSI